MVQGAIRPQPLIALQDVSLAFEAKEVLHNVTISETANRIAVVGRNGSGKTSLARVIAGLIPATSGEVHIAGVDVAEDRAAALETVGILFQNPDHQIIFPTVHEEIAFGLQQLGLPPADAEQGVRDILRRFGKPHWYDAAIHQLSQGQRQLVCLMAVLAVAPRLLILDEPFAGLDIPTTLHLQRVLNGLDTAILHITHDPRVVADYDHVLWIEEGRIVQSGSATEVLPAFVEAMKKIGASDDLADLAS